MLLLRNREDLNRMAMPLHLALGVFDGVHLGHQAVIAAARQRAGALGGSCGVVTFDPHPIRVLAPERAPRQLLASLEHKARLLGRLDMAFLLALEFNRALAEMSAEDFLQWLVGETNIATLAVGEDWRFGKARQGDVALLRQAGAARGFEVVSVAPVMHDGERISNDHSYSGTEPRAHDTFASCQGNGGKHCFNMLKFDWLLVLDGNTISLESL